MATASEQIRVTPETAQRLHDLKGRKETYNEAVERLLDAHAPLDEQEQEEAEA